MTYIYEFLISVKILNKIKSKTDFLTNKHRNNEMSELGFSQKHFRTFDKSDITDAVAYFWKILKLVSKQYSNIFFHFVSLNDVLMIVFIVVRLQINLK